MILRAPGSTRRQERTPFVGRQAELSSLRAHLAAGAHFVTLLGAPGVGKTRLGLQLVQAETDTEAAAFFVDLAEASTPVELGARIAAALGLSLAGEIEGQHLGDLLQSRGPLVLLLDNCESLSAESRELLDGVYARAPLLQIVATSRVRLGLDGERCFDVPPLAHADAVELYEIEAARIDPGAALDRAAVEELVDRLDCNPLAIRLAAARVRTFRPRLLLERIERRLDLLCGGPPGRHESLRRAIAHAWQLLDSHEAAALAQCAVFAGGFTLEAAEAVLDLGTGSDVPPVAEIIERLRSKALLVASEDDPPRFGLQESIRLFASLELERMGAAEAAWCRHASWYAERAEPPPPWIASSAHVRALVADEENLRVAMRRTASLRPALSARLALSLEPLLARRGAAGTVRHFEEALSAARASGDVTLLCRTLAARASALAESGEVEAARACAREALDLAEACGSALLRSIAQLELGTIRVKAGEPEDSVPLLRASAEGAATLGATALEGRSEMALGFALQVLGKTEPATFHTERSIALLERAGCERQATLALLNFGTLRLGEGACEEAHFALDRARGFAGGLGDKVLESSVLVHLGYLALVDGRLDAAERYLEEGRRLGRETARHHFEAIATGNLALVALERGQILAARHRIEEALPTLRSFGQPRFEAAFEAVRAATLAWNGDPERARLELDRARARAATAGDSEVRAAFDAFEGLIDLARAAEGGEGVEPHVRTAQARLDAALAGRPGAAGRIAGRILRAALARWDDRQRNPWIAPAADTVVVAADGRWFELPGRARVDLGTRRTLRRVLAALAERRLSSPGVGLSTDEVFAAGWPGERVLPLAANARVYDAIRVLRQLGLDAILLRAEDGYLLDAEHPLQRAAE